MSHTEQDNEPVPWMQQLLDYLKRKDPQRYAALIGRLGLRR